MGRGNHDHHPQDPEQQERVVLPFQDIFALHVPERQERHQDRDDQRQPLEEGAEIVDRVEIVEDAGTCVPQRSGEQQRQTLPRSATPPARVPKIARRPNAPSRSAITALAVTINSGLSSRMPIRVF